MHAAVGKESTVEQGEIRHPVNPDYVIKNNPTHSARHGPSMRQCMYYKAHDMLRKARKPRSGDYNTILERCHDDDKYRKSLSYFVCTEEQIIQYDAIELEDHSFVAAWQERSRNVKSWKISLNAEGIQGPLKQRSDFLEAKQKCQKLFDEHTAITGYGNKPSPSWTTSQATARSTM